MIYVKKKGCCLKWTLVFIIISSSIYFLLPNSAIAQERNPQIVYQWAVIYLAELDFVNTERWLNVLIRDFPESEEVKNAHVLKAIISVVSLDAIDSLINLLSSSEEALNEENKEKIQRYNERLDWIKYGIALDLVEQTLTRELFDIAGERVHIQIPRNYDSSKLTKEAFDVWLKLEDDNLPSESELEVMLKHEKDVSLESVTNDFLYISSVIDSKGKRTDSFNVQKTIEGDVNWIGCFMRIGNELDSLALSAELRDELSFARSFLTGAKKYFQKVTELLRDKPYNKIRMKAENRIEDIKSSLYWIEKKLEEETNITAEETTTDSLRRFKERLKNIRNFEN